MSFEQPLTYNELVRCHDLLWRRFRHVDGLMSIGFGIARRHGRVDPSRGPAVCFRVERKKERVPKSERLPANVGFRHRSSDFATDVLDGVPTLSGRRMRLTTGSFTDIATCGVLARWKEDSKDRFGFLTVGHPFAEVSIGQLVDLASTDGQYRTQGRLLARALPSTGWDIALVAIPKASLTELAPCAIGPPATVANDNVLVGKLSRSGTTTPFSASLLREDTTVDINVGVFYPEFYFANFGYIKDIFEATTSVASTFARGTSGAAWVSSAAIACLQTGSFEDSGFRRGLGQMVFTKIDWIEKQLRQLADYVEGTLRFHAAY